MMENRLEEKKKKKDDDERPDDDLSPGASQVV